MLKMISFYLTAIKVNGNGKYIIKLGTVEGPKLFV